jgi:hypothetical protein
VKGDADEVQPAEVLLFLPVETAILVRQGEILLFEDKLSASRLEEKVACLETQNENVRHVGGEK